MKHLLIAITTTIFFMLPAKAQELTIGQTVPGFVLARLINGSTTATGSSHLENKPLILLFWNTHCEVGLEFLPQLDSVQKQWDQKLAVLIITAEPLEKVTKALATKRILGGIGLPMLTGDTVLKKLFPHRVEPHLIWIDTAHRVQAITGHDQLTGANLASFTKGSKLNLPLKKEIRDKNVYFSLTPLMANQYEEQRKNTRFYTYLGGYRQGISVGSAAARFQTDDSVVRITATNVSLFRLYTLAYKQFEFFHKSRLIYKEEGQKGPNPFEGEKYCYDLMIKDTSKEKAYRYMQQDLDRYFGLTSSFEKRRMKVWVLRRTSGTDRLRAKGSGPADKYIENGKRIWKNYNWQYFVATQFNETSLLPCHMIDETGYKGKVDIELPTDLTNLKTVREAFRQYDLDCTEEEREIEVIVIRRNE